MFHPEGPLSQFLETVALVLLLLYFGLCLGLIVYATVVP